jgi:CBS domain-containing protein
MKVSELMTKDPACVTPEQTVQEAAEKMRQADCGLLPVIEGANGGRLVGVVTDRDIAVRAIGKGRGPDARVKDVMSANPSCCKADDDIEMVRRVMIEQKVRRVPVVDAAGHGIGIVSQADLALAADQRREVTDRDVAKVLEGVSQPGSQRTH